MTHTPPATHPALPPSIQRFRDAYLTMAKFYRPGAPGDGMGNINLTRSQLRNKRRLEREALQYATAFHDEEDTLQFTIGCSNLDTNQAFMWTIEAARMLAGGNDTGALKLLKLAQEQVEKVIKEYPRSPFYK